MTWQMIIFICCMALLYVLVAGGTGMYINAEKGRSKMLGFLFGALLPVFGLVIVGMNRPSSKYLIEESADRDLITPKEATQILVVAASKDNTDFAKEIRIGEATQVIRLGKKKSKN